MGHNLEALELEPRCPTPISALHSLTSTALEAHEQA